MVKEKYHHLLKKRDWKIAISVFLSGLSCFGLLYYYQALLPALSVYFKVDKATSSLAISSATFGMAIGLVTAMFVADRYNRRYIVGFSLLGAAILAFMTSFQNIFSILIVLNFLKDFFWQVLLQFVWLILLRKFQQQEKFKSQGFILQEMQ